MIQKPFNVLLYDVLDSTMNEAKRLLDSDSGRNTIVLADMQTGGRGRQNRPWISPAGNLYMSMIVDAVQPQQQSQFALLMGLVLKNVVSQYVSVGLQCKWPNDLLVDGKKIAGVLVELYKDSLIVGIGLNIEHCPENTMFPATYLRNHTNVLVAPVQLAESIGIAFDSLMKEWCAQGFESIRLNWLKSAWNLQSEINIRQERGYMVGIFETIDANGALLLKEATGEVSRHYVGDLIEEVK